MAPRTRKLARDAEHTQNPPDKDFKAPKKSPNAAAYKFEQSVTVKVDKDIDMKDWVNADDEDESFVPAKTSSKSRKKAFKTTDDDVVDPSLGNSKDNSQLMKSTTGTARSKVIPKPDKSLKRRVSKIIDLDSEDSGTDDQTPKHPNGRVMSMHLKAVKARERAFVEKLEAVTNDIKIKLPVETGKSEDSKHNNASVDCFYHVDNLSAPMTKQFDYVHLMKLASDRPFNLVKQVVLQEGEYKGHVAILLKQSLPFRLMELGKEIRAKIFSHVVNHADATIDVVAKQGGAKEAYAPSYRCKNRLALLIVSRRIRQEAATALFHNHTFHFSGTGVGTSFLVQLESAKKYVKRMTFDSYTPSSARIMFQLLRPARTIERLHFQHVSSNEQPKTASKNMFYDMKAWFEVVWPTDPVKAMEVISFGDKAFHMRAQGEEDSMSIEWGPNEYKEFETGLATRLKSVRRASAN